LQYKNISPEWKVAQKKPFQIYKKFKPLSISLTARFVKTIQLLTVLLCKCIALTWFFMAVNCVKRLLHTWQGNGFSPVCTLTWMVKLPDWLKHLPQYWHSKGFSPRWMRMCTCNQYNSKECHIMINLICEHCKKNVNIMNYCHIMIRHVNLLT